MNQLGIQAGGHYRVVEKLRMVEMLVHGGWIYEVRRGGGASSARAASRALDQWIELGLPFRQADGGEQRFDPAEVLNFLKWAGMHRGDRFWEERFVATGRKLVAELHPDAAAREMPPSPAALGPRRFTVNFRREFDLRGCRPGARMRLRLPLPLEDDALRDLNVVSIAPPGVDVDFTIAPGRLDARFVAPVDPMVALSVQLSFTAYPTLPTAQRSPMTAETFELYTRAGEGIVQISDRIRALATDLAGSRKEPWELVQRFWNFMLDRLTSGVVHYDEVSTVHPTDWVLETGWFDCRLGSALLVALCRAQGIAARIVGGYLLYPTSPANHYWAEVWFDERGWVSVDLICSGLSANGRDREWRDYFFGQLDYRMKTECLPRLFTGMPNVRLPPAWHVVTRHEGEGTEIGIYANESGRLIYRDQIAVRRADDPPRVNAAPL